jgi:hypothetical protein
MFLFEYRIRRVTQVSELPLLVPRGRQMLGNRCDT